MPSLRHAAKDQNPQLASQYPVKALETPENLAKGAKETITQRHLT
jgi:hypothetical protein